MGGRIAIGDEATTLGREAARSPAALRVGTGGNLPRIKARNLSIVLDAVRKLQPLSRTDLAALTGLTRATMTNLVAELIELGLLREVAVARSATEGRLGRRPTSLFFNGAAAVAIGLEISRTAVRGLLTDLEGRIIDRAAEPLAAARDVPSTLRIVHRLIAALAAGREDRVCGVGIGVPGPVDSRQGIVRRPPSFPGWRDAPLVDLVRGRWSWPTFLDDDAKTSALGECWFGCGRSTPNLLYVSVGAGIGSGLIVRGELYRGTHELAGELGHTALDLDDPPCECGNRGCLESFVAIPAIVQRARDLGLTGPGSGALDVEQVHRAAASGDAVARAVKDQTYRYLAAGVLNAVNFCDPDLIVLGGPLVLAWPDLCKEVSTRVRGRSFGFASSAISITSASLGSDAAALGAAGLAIEHVVRTPSLVRRTERS